jgi:hypothetical protein
MKLRHVARLALLAFAIGSASCGTVREGSGTSFLILDSLQFTESGGRTTFVGNAVSDVETVVEDSPTVFADLARATFRLGLKDPGSAASPTSATQNQAITVNRVHVRYFRTDGRNVQGVDVPYEFDAAMGITVAGGGTAAPVFEYVRISAKLEAPLRALRTNGVIVTMMAEFTFYGQDQTGHEVSASAQSSVAFGNFGDPQ